jgi:hypothetical protein
MKIFVKFYPLLCLLYFLSCAPSNEIINLQTDQSNALRTKFLFSTEKEATVTIEFWETNTIDHYLSERSVDKKDHEITLLKLKPKTLYHYEFIIEDRDNLTRSDENTFKTDSLPDILPTMDLVVDNGDVFQGYLLIRNVQQPGQQILLDNTGQIVWFQEFDTALFRPFSWTEKQTILALKSDKIIQEFDLKGNFVFEQSYNEKGFTHLLHHEVINDEQGNIISLTRNNQQFDLSSVGGGIADTVKGDGILVLDAKGNKVWEWDIFKFADPLKDKDINKKKDDWSHANALSIAEDGHYLVSFRYFNQIWKIHSNTGEVLWKLGEQGDFSLTKDQVFYLQHAVHINSRGELMLFDNGGPQRPVSRAISFNIDSQNNKVSTATVNVFLPKGLVSFKQGSAYLIEDDKVLFCSSIKRSIVITDLEGHILWHLKMSESVYRAAYIQEINWLSNKVQ